MEETRPGPPGESAKIRFMRLIPLEQQVMRDAGLRRFGVPRRRGAEILNTLGKRPKTL